MKKTDTDSLEIRHSSVSQSTPSRKPRIAASVSSMRTNNTGSWRNMRPIHAFNQLAPCTHACPIGVHIPAFLDLLEHNEIRRAWLKILEMNPLPGVCGRVCYHPCESACNRTLVDSVVANHILERFVADSQMKEILPPHPLAGSRLDRVAVIGSGPAGLSCAYHLACLGYEVIIYESGKQAGGILRTGIPPYRLPREILDKEIADILSQGIELELQTTLGGDLQWNDLHGFKAVFLATGAHRSRRLGLPREDAQGVSSALDFLKAVNSGFPPTLGKRVLVIGGGNTAIDAARTALRLGSEVVILYRRTRDEMPAVPDEVDEAIHEGVRLHFLAAPARLITQNGRICSVEVQRMELGEPDASGRRSPKPIAGLNFFLTAETVLSAIGEDPDTDYISEKVVKTGSKIAVNEEQATGHGGLYAGGDAATSPAGTVAYAIRSGRVAAGAIHRKLSGEIAPSPSQVLIGPHRIRPCYFQPAPSAKPRVRAIRTLVGDFEEINLGFLENEAREEASRCLRCGFCTSCNNCVVFCPDNAVSYIDSEKRYAIELQHSKGCGICMEDCTRGSIMMLEEWRT